MALANALSLSLESDHSRVIQIRIGFGGFDVKAAGESVEAREEVDDHLDVSEFDPSGIQLFGHPRDTLGAA